MSPEPRTRGRFRSFYIARSPSRAGHADPPAPWAVRSRPPPLRRFVSHSGDSRSMQKLSECGRAAPSPDADTYRSYINPVSAFAACAASWNSGVGKIPNTIVAPANATPTNTTSK